VASAKRLQRAPDTERTEQVARRQAFRAYGAPPLVARAAGQSEAAVAQQTRVWGRT